MAQHGIWFLFALPFYLICGCDTLDKRLLAGAWQGDSFVGAGRTELSFQLKGVGIQAVAAKDLPWDAIRLNMNSETYLDFNDIPVTTMPGEPLARMYLSIRMQQNPRPGTFASGIFSGPDFSFEVYSPQRTLLKESPESRLLAKARLGKGQVVFSDANPVLGGKLAGSFKFYSGSGDFVTGTFDLRLKEPPPVFPVK